MNHPADQPTPAEFAEYVAEYNAYLDAEHAKISIDRSILTPYNSTFQYVTDNQE
jgi:inosine-uridine nucleoside N-ribohydrolase